MAVKDHVQHFPGLNTAPVNPVPNTVSRGMMTGDRSFSGVVCEAGKPILDSEVNLRQEALWMQDFLRERWNTPSGWLRGSAPSRATNNDFIFVQSGGGISDDTPGGGHIAGDGTLIDALLMRRREALVAGFPVVVEFSNTSTAAYNLLPLTAPTIYDGTNATVKRTDFLFLEVWRSLVAPSPKAEAWVQVVDPSQIDTAGPDQVILNGNPLSAIAAPGPPGVDQYVVDPASDVNTAANIAAAINLGTNSFLGDMTARALGNRVLLRAATPGTAGNALLLSLVTAVPGTVLASGPLFTGGQDRPNKPDQASLYRHGNVESPAATWLPDEINDPVYDRESSQRIQVQYRIRATGAPEGVNYKQHPDGYSQNTGGVPTILAQGGQAAPVARYPFVPANQTDTWLFSSSVAYGWRDDGLWVAGDGGQTAAQDLGALDGFVYSIPLGFVFRHNDASDPAAVLKGFDPLNNTNAGPTYGHANYVGVLGAVLAGQSDRPDGGYCDVISQDQFLDLRRHVIPAGVNYQGELQFQMQTLLDNKNRTWAMDTASKQYLGDASGDVSTRFLVCNEVGRSAGTPPVAGHTRRGPLVRQWDHIARRFGDQSVIERVCVAFWPGDRQVAGPVAPGTVNAGRYVAKAGGGGAAGTWYEGDVLHLDLNFLDVIRLGGVFDSRAGAGDGGGVLPGGPAAVPFMFYAPPGTAITDVLSVWHDDGHYDFGDPTHPQEVQVGTMLGLGTPHIEVTLDANDTPVTGGLPAPPNPLYQMVGRAGGGAPGSDRRIFVEIEITYPMGVGMTDLPDLDPQIQGDTFYGGSNGVGPGTLIEADLTQRPNDWEYTMPPLFRGGYREVHQEYIANDTTSHDPGLALPGTPIGGATPEFLVSRDRFTVVFPRRVYDEGGVPVGLQVSDIPGAVGKTVDRPNSAFGHSARSLVLDAALSGAGRTLCGVWYFAQDPPPNYGVAGGGWQISYYYRALTPQTAGVVEGDISTAGGGVLPSTLTVRPVVMPGSVWTSQAGVGSNEESFPYSRPDYAIPINDGTPLHPVLGIAGLTEEWYFSGVAQVSVADFQADTGLLNLHAFVQQDVQNDLVLGGVGPDEKPRKDAEFRAFYPFADDTTYRPVLMAQSHSGAVRHKVYAPFLATISTEVPGANGGILFRKNELVLVVLSRFAEFDVENNVWFLDVDNRTLAAVYRTTNLLLVVGE